MGTPPAEPEEAVDTRGGTLRTGNGGIWHRANTWEKLIYTWKYLITEEHNILDAEVFAQS